MHVVSIAGPLPAYAFMLLLISSDIIISGFCLHMLHLTIVLMLVGTFITSFNISMKMFLLLSTISCQL